MKNREFVFALGGFLIGVILMLLIVQAAATTRNFDMRGMMGIRNQGNMMQTAMDAHFIEQMIPHHENAIAMAKLALQESNRPEIKTLSQNIIDSQSKEINQMKDWYKSWYGREVAAGDQITMPYGMGRGMLRGMVRDGTDIQTLENAANFDQAFIEEMIPHHQMAVMMAGMLQRGTTRPEMKQLAEDIISSQTKEIGQMRQWYKEWGY